MSKYVLSRDDLLEHLREQVSFLDASAVSYDAGLEGEAKRLATVMRVLLHDTAKSASVLGQLGVKDSIRYLDTAEPINPRNMISTAGLVIMEANSERGGRYVAPLDDRFAVSPRAASFDHWWTTPVTKDSSAAVFSRRNYVLALSNKEGGAHVDRELDSAYAALSRNNSLGWLYTDQTTPEGRAFDNNPALPSVRQIAHELIATLRAQLTPLLEPGADPSTISLPQALLQGVERNGPCLCGSGLKAKRCHLR
jgi:hypothetical protein